MRGSDKFYAEFTLVKGVNCTIGVVRSDFDIERTKLACSTPDGWGYYARMGSCHHNKPRAQGSWVGQKSSREGDTIGLLLDPSRGTLSVFLNGSKAGDMVRTGLPRGESLCWMVQLCDGAEVRIEKKPVPDTSSYGSSYSSRTSSSSSSETVEAYLKRVGLDAWRTHFQTHLPANVKSVALVRATTAADLRRMGTKANMRLDNQTIQQVLNALSKK